MPSTDDPDDESVSHGTIYDSNVTGTQTHERTRSGGTPRENERLRFEDERARSLCPVATAKSDKSPRLAADSPCSGELDVSGKEGSRARFMPVSCHRASTHARGTSGGLRTSELCYKVPFTGKIQVREEILAWHLNRPSVQLKLH